MKINPLILMPDSDDLAAYAAAAARKQGKDVTFKIKRGQGLLYVVEAVVKEPTK